MSDRILDILAQRRRLLLSRGGSVPAPDGHGDIADQVVAARLYELAASTRSSRFEQLRAIDMAVQRVHEGTYGICERCEEPIGARRLEAIPEATYCRGCQEAIEAAARRNGGPAWADEEDT